MKKTSTSEGFSKLQQKLIVKFAATVIVCRARQRQKNIPDVLKLSDLVNADNTLGRISDVFANRTERVFRNGWEFLMGQSEVQNHLRSTPNKISLMRYGGEFKFAGGSVDHGESLEEAARRELSEEFLCQVPPNAKLRLLSVKQTRPVQNTSYIMHNFVCLESENDWLQQIKVPTVNNLLAQRRIEFNKVKDNGDFYQMNRRDKEKICPEVHCIEWLDMKTAVTYAFTSMNRELQYVNDYQRREFLRLSVTHRDPLFITLTVMTDLDKFSNIDEIIQFTDSLNVDEEREKVTWLRDGMDAEEVQQILIDKQDFFPRVEIDVKDEKDKGLKRKRDGNNSTDSKSSSSKI
jgi:8-oxo-dGTP pyrophosphatase MutT (NUDIX family)